MSSVNVSLNDISNFNSKVSDLKYDMERNHDSFNSLASTLESKASKAQENAEKKIILMNDDLREIGFVKKHNDELLKTLYEALKRLEEREKSAVANLESAMSAQTNAHNSSSGSTEEEKKAHEAAVKSADSAVRSAESSLNAIRREKRAVENKIYRTEQANRRLEEMRRNIEIYRHGAMDYINNVKTAYSNFRDKKSTYESVYQREISSVYRVMECAENAEKHIKKAIDNMGLALDNSNATSDTIYMTNTRVLADTASLLRSMKNTVETYSKKQKESMGQFMDTLGDDVSRYTAKMGRQVMDDCIVQTKKFDKMADYLLEAKRNLDNYTKINV